MKSVPKENRYIHYAFTDLAWPDVKNILNEKKGKC